MVASQLQPPAMLGGRQGALVIRQEGPAERLVVQSLVANLQEVKIVVVSAIDKRRCFLRAMEMNTWLG